MCLVKLHVPVKAYFLKFELGVSKFQFSSK